MINIDEAALIVTKSLVLRKPFHYSSLPDQLVKAGWITRVRAGNQEHSSRYRLWPVSTAEFEGQLAHARVMEKLKRNHALGRRLTASPLRRW